MATLCSSSRFKADGKQVAGSSFWMRWFCGFCAHDWGQTNHGQFRSLLVWMPHTYSVHNRELFVVFFFNFFLFCCRILKNQTTPTSSLPLEPDQIFLDCFLILYLLNCRKRHLFFFFFPQFLGVFSDSSIVEKKKKKLELFDVYRCTICTEVVTFCSHR